MTISTQAPRTLLLIALCGIAPLGLSCSSTGGGGPSGSGGHVGSGGSSGSGGATSSGGTTASGGTTGSGGGTSSGGTSASGGTTGSGGMTSSGGTTGSGGTAATGGAIGSGGGGGGLSGATGGGHGGGMGGRGDSGGGTGTGGAPADGGVADVVVHDGPTMSGGAYVRTGWTAVYMCTGTCPDPKDPSMDMSDPDTGRAFDKDPTGTRWSTRNYQQYAPLMAVFPLYFTFDMKEVNIVSKITTAAGGDPYDAPGEMDVLVSLDGTNFTVALAGHKPSSPSTGKMDTIMFPQPTAARYIQLKATKTIKQVDSTLGDRFWAIGDLNVYP